MTILISFLILFGCTVVVIILATLAPEMEFDATPEPKRRCSVNSTYCKPRRQSCRK